jgi:hypothetical protein
MHERARRLIEGAGADGPARRARTPEHPLLFLQRTAGNAAVSRLVADMTVQRDDGDDETEEEEEEWQPTPEEEAAEEAAMVAEAVTLIAAVSGPGLIPAIGGLIYEELVAPDEELEKNPEVFPNAPAEGPEPEWPEPEWQEPGPLPEPEGPGGGPTPGPGGPTGPGPSAGPAGPGGIPGMEPVTPGGGPGPGGTRPMLRVGSTGDAVRQAQELLVRHGATLVPDGQFGPRTKRAVIDLQRSAGLTPDGIVGPRTWRALEAG